MDAITKKLVDRIFCKDCENYTKATYRHCHVCKKCTGSQIYESAVYCLRCLSSKGKVAIK